MLKRFVAAMIVLLLCLGPALPTFAAVEGEEEGRFAAYRFARGLINLTTGWVELPNQMVKETEDHHMGRGLTTGTLKGIGQGIVRTLWGAFDLLTFPIPADREEWPEMDPEYVLADPTPEDERL